MKRANRLLFNEGRCDWGSVTTHPRIAGRSKGPLREHNERQHAKPVSPQYGSSNEKRAERSSFRRPGFAHLRGASLGGEKSITCAVFA
jgi:hypothetical protein